MKLSVIRARRYGKMMEAEVFCKKELTWKVLLMENPDVFLEDCDV
jgi:hypothetical protein